MVAVPSWPEAWKTYSTATRAKSRDSLSVDDPEDDAADEPADAVAEADDWDPPVVVGEPLSKMMPLLVATLS